MIIGCCWISLQIDHFIITTALDPETLDHLFHSQEDQKGKRIIKRRAATKRTESEYY